jgi:catechol 2,3-dioxygenase-like lactoylglutathione lyase family enzyme
MQTLGLVLWLTLPMAVLPQPAASRTEPLFKGVGGAFVALSVADLRASTKWYSEKLGLTVVMEVPKKDGATVTVLEGGGLIVELIQLDAAVPLRRAAPRATGAQYVHGIFKVGLVVEEFDQTVAALRARGVEIVIGPFPRRENQRANVIIKDNAGNLIQVFGK